MRHTIILIMIVGTMSLAYAGDTGTWTIRGTQTATGALAIRDGYFIYDSEQGICGVRIIFKRVSDALVGGNNQGISNHVVSFEAEPDIEQEFTDESGSPCYYIVWGDTTGSQVNYPDSGCFVVYQNGDLSMASTLDGFEDGTPHDYTNCPDSVARFLLPVPYEVQSDNQAIIDFAQNEFTYACQFRYEVVSNVIKWVADNLQYRSPSTNPYIDALGVFSDTLDPNPLNRYRTHCVGFSHLAIAFLRALGIPARYVAGNNFTANYRVPRGDGTFLSFLLNYGAHAWLEVYYPNVGWIPYDGQGYLHHTDVLRYRKCHGTGHKDAHPEINRAVVVCPDDNDTYSFDYENHEWSTIDCIGSVCSIDNLQFVSHDPTYPTTATVISDSAYAPAGACCVVPGDINDDSKVSVGDAVFLITYIFRGGQEPNCMTAADTNHDCRINVGDAVYIISYVFKGGPPPDCDPCKSYQVRGIET